VTIPAGQHTNSSVGNPNEADGEDEAIDGEIVRGFMLTRGRTRSVSAELPIETVVSAPLNIGAALGMVDREQRRIRELLLEPMSIAEVSAYLKIPLRAAVVLVSEMVAAGSLSASATADAGDTDLLHKIRSALQLL
jgi:hypothetical protein